MMNERGKITYPAPTVCEDEILRYAGCRKADEATLSLLRDCLEEALPVLSYTVCYRLCSLSVENGVCRIGDREFMSQKLALRLSGCDKAVLFAATVGVGLDRLIAKYGRLSPAKGLMMQAIGAERIEALCDAFCKDVAEQTKQALTPRFSPGYGDLPLEIQPTIVALTDAQKQIGIGLTESLLMTPSKSVTAIIGLANDTTNTCQTKSCSDCDAVDCDFRRTL